ncbi:MAG: DUF6081 family protein [Candidatus Brocadiia bacterium]
MNQRATGGDDDLRTYDDFRTPAINPDKWVTAKLPLGGGKVWEYFDPNTAIRTGDGRCEITVNPFSRSHDSIQIADNPKTLFACREPLDLAGAQVLTLSADVGAESHGTNVHDIWDGFVTLNLFDFESGIVLDFLLNGRRVYALYERLFMPGLTDEDTAFTREANLTVHSRPRQMHRCAFVYDRSRDTAEWRLDGELAYRVAKIPVKVNRFSLGMGLMTLKPIAAPLPYYFPKSTSNHGQGITGIWSNIRLRIR